MLLWITITLGVLIFLFRQKLKAKLIAAVPDKTTRHRVIGTIIAAFAIVFAIRLLVRYWSN